MTTPPVNGKVSRLKAVGRHDISSPAALLAIDIEKLLHRDHGEVSLVQIEPLLRNMVKVLHPILAAGPSETPEGLYGQMQNWSAQLVQLCEKAAQLDIKRADFHSNRESLINEFRNLWTTVGQYRGHSVALQSSELAALTENARRTLVEVRSISEEALKAKDEAEKAAKAA